MNAKTNALLTRAGFVLLYVQVAEAVLKRCLYYLRVPGLSLETLEEKEEKERRRVLGYFLEELRKHVEISSDFESELAAFLKGRNDLVHNFFRETNFSLATGEGYDSASNFLRELTRRTGHVTQVLYGLVIVQHEAISMVHDPAGKVELSEMEKLHKDMAMVAITRMRD